MIKMHAHTHTHIQGCREQTQLCGIGAMSKNKITESQEGELTFETDKSHCLASLYSLF